uniref:HDC17765 n=1 Tax=Drosophila melanogaster TaxID=7227 RepID=Q6IIK7_DROME|nr:TPA_inf: HDC17765 [Drosophila melanogaster]
MKNASTARTGGQDLPLNRTELTTAQLGATASRESVVRSPESVGHGSQPANCQLSCGSTTLNSQLPTPSSTNAIEECCQWGISPSNGMTLHWR